MLLSADIMVIIDYGKGNEDIIIVCSGCDKKITNWSNIFEGKQTSYICPDCEYDGYANKFNTKISIKIKKKYGYRGDD